MVILSIETSCDETAVSIIKASGSFQNPKFKILGNTLISQIDIHKPYGGVFPILAKREHAKNLIPLFLASLEEAGLLKPTKNKLSPKEKQKIEKLLARESEMIEAFLNLLQTVKKPRLDAIAVTYGPGLEPALWVGINFARALATAWQIPLIPINHMEGHIFSSMVDEKKDKRYKIKGTRNPALKFPALALLVSGGHTELVLMKAPLKYKRIGETRDDAVGEAFDKVARMMDLPYPGGPKISNLAEETRAKKFTPKYPLPRPMINSGDLDFSFSGLKTAVLYTVKKIPKLTVTDKRHIAREFEDAVVEVLVSKTRDALIKHKPKTFMIGGGVIANKEIRHALTELIQNEFPKTKILFPEIAMSTDNAVMIAAAAYMRASIKKPVFSEKNIKSLKASGSLRL